jgi:hypothetical protein
MTEDRQQRPEEHQLEDERDELVDHEHRAEGDALLDPRATG